MKMRWGIFLVIVVGSLGIVVAAWVWYWEHFAEVIPQADWEKFGQFGDAFGPLGALFSALAFWGVIVTVLLQLAQMRTQQEEMAKAEGLQRQSAQALMAQAAMNERSTKLAAINSVISGIRGQLE